MKSSRHESSAVQRAKREPKGIEAEKKEEYPNAMNI